MGFYKDYLMENAKKVVLILLLLVLLSCNVQNKNKQNHGAQKHTEIVIDTFDIETFNKNKVNDEYNFVLDNGTKFRQTSSESSYSEYITPPKPELFIEFRGYYKNGSLKRYSIRYPNNFQKIRKEYDETGKLIEAINYDIPFKFTFEQLLALLKKEKDAIDIFDTNTVITRGVIEEGTIWEVEWKKTFGRRETLKVDGITGEVLERSFYPMKDN